MGLIKPFRKLTTKRENQKFQKMNRDILSRHSQPTRSCPYIQQLREIVCDTSAVINIITTV